MFILAAAVVYLCEDGMPMNAQRTASRLPVTPNIALLLAVCSVGIAGAQAPSAHLVLADQARFLQQVRSKLQSDRSLQRRYTYREKQTDVRLNDKGEVLGKSVKIFDVYPPLSGAEAYRRPISVDGLPVGREKLENDDRNHRNQVLEHLRLFESESPDQRERRLRLEAEDTRKENDAIDDAFQLYDFRLVGRERFAGYEAVLLTFVPAPGLEPRTNEGRLLKNFSGRAWIAEQDCQLIRVELEAIGDVSMGFGFLARFYKGSRVVFERRRVSDTVWLPSELSYTVGGRVLLVKKLRVQAVREYSDYKELGVDALMPLWQYHSGK
jgi:hypothetical protein